MRIKYFLSISLVSLVLIGLNACGQNTPAEKNSSETKTAPSAKAAGAAESSPYILTASIHDIMLSIIDPSADDMWNSVSTISTMDGITENRPRTDKDWEELRHRAITLIEATNLLAMPGRRVVLKGQKLQDAGLEGNLTAAQIQKLIDAEHKTFVSFAHGLHGAGMEMLKAIDNQDVDAFLQAGGDLDTACEACHTKYWYPGHGIPGGD